MAKLFCAFSSGLNGIFQVWSDKGFVWIFLEKKNQLITDEALQIVGATLMH